MELRITGWRQKQVCQSFIRQHWNACQFLPENSFGRRANFPIWGQQWHACQPFHLRTVLVSLLVCYPFLTAMTNTNFFQRVTSFTVSRLWQYRMRAFHYSLLTEPLVGLLISLWQSNVDRSTNIPFEEYHSKTYQLISLLDSSNYAKEQSSKQWSPATYTATPVWG